MNSCRAVLPLLLAFWMSPAALPAQGLDFSEARLRDGKEAFREKRFSDAVEQFRLASFGFLERPELLSETLARLALAEEAARRPAGTEATLNRFVEIERRFESFREESLEEDLRRDFRALLPKRVPRETLLSVPTLAPLLGFPPPAGSRREAGRTGPRPAADSPPPTAPSPTLPPPMLTPTPTVPPPTATPTPTRTATRVLPTQTPTPTRAPTRTATPTTVPPTATRTPTRPGPTTTRPRPTLTPTLPARRTPTLLSSLRQSARFVPSEELDLSPRVKDAVNPVYPPDALQARIRGLVVLRVLVSESGLPLEIRVIQNARAGLTQAAVEAVRQWTFEPAVKAGAAVRTWTTVRIPFEAIPFADQTLRQEPSVRRTPASVEIVEPPDAVLSEGGESFGGANSFTSVNPLLLIGPVVHGLVLPAPGHEPKIVRVHVARDAGQGRARIQVSLKRKKP